MGVFDPKGAVVIDVSPNGAAASAGVHVGDELLAVNGRQPTDLMDLLDQANWGDLQLRIRRGEQIFETRLRKSDDEPLGMQFSDTLFTRVKTCRNKCVFCFMDQMPKKMRGSLYYRDDDFRLSTLHGNFITLTNLSPEDWERIKTQRVSPLYVSVHATDEDLREELLGATRQARMAIMEILRQLVDWGVELHTQIVLMPGLNDGAQLDRSLEDLLSLGSAVRTVSIVPVGLTKYRAHLPALDVVTPVKVHELIAQVAPYQRRCLEEWGEPVVYLADEMYLIAGLPMPAHGHYLDYPQLENGIGMVRRFLVDFKRRLTRLPRRLETPRRWLLITGEYGGMIFPPLIEELHRRVENLTIRLCAVQNDFFGRTVKCSGLLAGRDIAAALEREHDFLQGQNVQVMVPGNSLKDAAVVGGSGEGMFLDDISMQALSDRFGVPLVNGGSRCAEWLEGILRQPDVLRTYPNAAQPTPIVLHHYPEHAPVLR